MKRKNLRKFVILSQQLLFFAVENQYSVVLKITNTESRDSELTPRQRYAYFKTKAALNEKSMKLFSSKK